MQIDVGQEWRNTATLDRPHFTACSLPILQHAGAQPFLDESHDAFVPDSVLDKLDQPFVDQGSEEVPNVGVEHPVHLLRRDSDRECIQRLMRAASWSKSVRETEKVHLVYGIAYLDRRSLDDFVFQCRHSERP